MICDIHLATYHKLVEAQRADKRLLSNANRIGDYDTAKRLDPFYSGEIAKRASLLGRFSSPSPCPTCHDSAWVAQMEEQRVRNASVVGSSPALGFKYDLSRQP